MFNLFGDMFDDYYYQPKRQTQTPRRKQQQENDIYDQLFGEFVQNRKQQDQPACRFENQNTTQKSDTMPKSSKVTVNQKIPVQAATVSQKPQQIQTPPRNVHEPSDDKKITNREWIDPPEVAFKTYRPSNVLITVPQIVKPADDLSKNHLTTHTDKAVVHLNRSEAEQQVEVQVTAKGKLIVKFGQTQLQYDLPAFYERSEVKARRVESGIEISIPVCSNESDDVMLVQIE